MVGLYCIFEKIIVMVNTAKLNEQFAGLVGFNQPNDPQYPKIYPSLAVSTSGRIVQQAHPLCTIENIYNVAPEFAKFNYPLYAAGTDYKAGDRVKYNTKIYSALLDTTGATPDASPDDWKVIDPFSEWLQGIYNSSVVDLVTQVIRSKKMDNVHRSLVDSLRLYDGVGRLTDRVIKSNRFVGFEIAISSQEGMAVLLDKIGIQVDTAQASLTFYLYHSSSFEPLGTYTIDVPKNNTFSWRQLINPAQDLKTAMLTYLADHDTDGVFYFGYYEEDLVGQVFNKQKNFTVRPCIGCNEFDSASFNAWSRYVTIKSISVGQSYLDVDANLFDTSRVVYVADTNWGLNLSLTVTCDMTDFMIKNKAITADVLAMQICLNLLYQMGYNTRIGAISDKAKLLALSELNPDPKSDSFRVQYENAVAALRYDFSGFSSACLPSDKKSRILKGAI
jgi:hypothetical protein